MSGSLKGDKAINSFQTIDKVKLCLMWAYANRNAQSRIHIFLSCDRWASVRDSRKIVSHFTREETSPPQPWTSCYPEVGYIRKTNKGGTPRVRQRRYWQ
ncbi:hypothetical protein TNCV_2265891 [Trichonephila clavipes]|nr:hypothetical protein TNCV_2265891 [Trichonephila clavipes]